MPESKHSPAALKMKEEHSLDELRDKAKELKLPTNGQTKIDLASAIVAELEANPPTPPASRAEAIARAKEQDFLPEDDTAAPAPVVAQGAGDLERARKAAQAAEEEARNADKPDPKGAVSGKDVPAVPRQGRLTHTGRWHPKDVIVYTNTRGHRVTRKPEIMVPGYGIQPNVLDDIPPGVAQNAYQRGLLAPEMA